MASFNERVTALINRYLRDATGTTANAKVESAFLAIKEDRQNRCIREIRSYVSPSLAIKRGIAAGKGFGRIKRQADERK